MNKPFNLISRLRWVAQCSRVKYPTIRRIHLSFLYQQLQYASGFFWTENNFHFISNCRNWLNYKLKKLINEQIIIFYSHSNAVCSSDKSVLQMINFKHTFIGMCSLPAHFKLQILDFCYRRHIKIEQM